MNVGGQCCKTVPTATMTGKHAFLEIPVITLDGLSG